MTVTTQTGMAEMSIAQMVELYNLITDKPVKKFKDKGTAMARLQKQLDDSGMEAFQAGENDWDVRASSAEVDPTEDAEQPAPKPKSRKKKKAPGKKTGGRVSPLLGRKITVVRRENPKRAGSRTHVRYALYSTVRTSDEFLAKCLEQNLGTRREILSDLAWDSSQEFIKLS